MRLTYPGIGTLLITGSTKYLLDKMLNCAQFPQDSIVREYTSFGALFFGLISLIESDYDYHLKKNYHQNTSERYIIDLICSSKHPDHELSNFQKDAMDRICSDYKHNSAHDLKMLCGIVGSSEHCE